LARTKLRDSGRRATSRCVRRGRSDKTEHLERRCLSPGQNVTLNSHGEPVPKRAQSPDPVQQKMPLKDGSAEDYKSAAARHYLDACTLKAGGQYDNAGHLIGFAAECAIKHQMAKVSQPAANLHLPELLASARRQLGSRVGYTSMYDVLKTETLAGWAIDHR